MHDPAEMAGSVLPQESNCRKKFEIWARENKGFTQAELHRFDETNSCADQYCDSMVQDWFEGWKAAWESK